MRKILGSVWSERVSCGLIFILGMWVMSTLSLAQNFTGFRGQVTDTTGAVMVGVALTATDEDKGLVYSTVTNEVGLYELRGILPATYTITAEASGFKRYENTGVIVFSESPRRVDIVMEIGELADAITVTEEGSRIETETPTVTYKTPDKEVYYRNVQASMIYTVGAAPGHQSRNELHGMYSNNMAPVQDGILTHAYGFFRFPQEALQEVHLKTQNAGAEYQHANTIIGVGRSGTNEFHGEIYSQFRHARLNAKNRSLPRRPKPETAAVRWSFEASGPVWIPKVYDGRNKTFFHALYQPVSSFRFENATLTYPTRRMRTGDLTEVVPFTPNRQITNPYTGQPFPNNIIPKSMWNPLAFHFVDLLPVPQNSDLVNNFIALSEHNRSTPWEHYRFDHKISEANTISFSHFRFTFFGDNGQLDYGPWDGGRVLTGPTRAFSIIDSHVFSPTVVNEFSLGRNRQRFVIDANFTASEVLKTLDPNGIIDFGGRPYPTGKPGAPQIIASTMGQLANVGGSFNPRPINALGGGSASRSAADQTYTVMLKDNLSVQRGTHLIKLGFSNIWTLSDNESINLNSYGRWQFTGNFTGWDFGDVLLGLPFRTEIASTRGPVLPRYTQVGVFFQDDWKVTPRITFTPGLRFQQYGAPRDASGFWYNFDFRHLADGGTGRVVVPNEALRRVDPAYPTGDIPVVTQGEAGYPKNLFKFKGVLVQPRLGVAVRVTDTMVIRAGYGIYHVPPTPPQEGAQSLSGFTSGPFELSESFGPNEIVNGVPLLTFDRAFPAPGSGAIPLQSVNSVGLKTRSERWPSDQQWNLTLEKELGNGFTGRGSYVGAKGTHWPYTINRQIPPASTIPFTASRKPFGSAPYDRITDYLVGANQSYHGMEWELLRQFSSGLYMRAWYEYRIALNDVEGGKFGWVGLGGFASEDPYDRARDKGWSAGHAQQQARVMGIYDLPLGKGQTYLSNASGPINQIVGNWTIAPELGLSAGRRTTPVFSGADPANVGRSGGRPDILPGCDPNGFGSPTDPAPAIVWNRSCFEVPREGTYGTATRGVLRQPRDPRFSINIFKTIPLTPYEWGPYFKIEAYISNPFNHTNPSGPGSFNINDPRFGLYRASGGGRTIFLRLRIGF